MGRTRLSVPFWCTANHGIPRLKGVRHQGTFFSLLHWVRPPSKPSRVTVGFSLCIKGSLFCHI